MRNCAFGLEFVTARKAGRIFGFFVYYVIEHSVARYDALCCRSKYSVARQSTQSHRSKHSVARHDALSSRGMTNTGQPWSFSERSKHSDARQSILSNRGNTLSRITMLYAVEASTLSRDRVLYPFAKTFCRPSEYFRKPLEGEVGSWYSASDIRDTILHKSQISSSELLLRDVGQSLKALGFYWTRPQNKTRYLAVEITEQEYIVNMQKPA